MTQGVLTVVTEIAPERVDALRALLDVLDHALDGEPGAPPIVDFRELDSVHFARFVVLPANSAGRRHLVFSTAYDGPRQVHLAELAQRVGDGLCTLYEHCVGFPAGAARASAMLLPYLEKYSVPHAALHVGYVGRTVSDIRKESQLRQFLEARLDTETAKSASLTAVAVRARLIDWVRKSEFRWALAPRSEPIAQTGVERWWTHPVGAGVLVLGLVGGGVAAFSCGSFLGLAAYTFVVVGVVGAGVLALRWHEKHEPAKSDSNVARGSAHTEDEDFGLRNQLSHLVDVKPGAFRRTVLRAVLYAVELRARLEFWKGDLGGLETIHAAHWLVLDDGAPRLLFFSNYDGSWERYLGDFIEETGGGMTSVWSNTVEFPRTRFLLWGGVSDERVFKAWAREKQIQTQVWYAATPALSIRNVNDNSKLRDGLRGFMTEEEAQGWLRLL